MFWSISIHTTQRAKDAEFCVCVFMLARLVTLARRLCGEAPFVFLQARFFFFFLFTKLVLDGVDYLRREGAHGRTGMAATGYSCCYVL